MSPNLPKIFNNNTDNGRQMMNAMWKMIAKILGYPNLDQIICIILLILTIIMIKLMDERNLRGDEDEDMLGDPILDVGDPEEAGHEHLHLVGFQESEDIDCDGGGEIKMEKKIRLTCSGLWAHL